MSAAGATLGGVPRLSRIPLPVLAVASLIDTPVTAALGWIPGVILLSAVTLIGLGSLGTAVYRTIFICKALRRMEIEAAAKAKASAAAGAMAV